jgi:LysR family transcriptional regulator, regulator for bpeEF and oprC
MPRTEDRVLFDGVVPFIAVAETLSFRRAGERLGVTSAAVSKAVLGLEARLGTTLLLRTSRAVTLTPEGERFLRHSTQAVGNLRAAHDEVQRARAPEGLLRVSLSTIITPVLTARLGLFFARFPRAQLQLESTNQLARFPTDRVDLALRLGALQDSSLVARVVGRTRWMTVAAPSFLARKGTPRTLDDLGGLDAVQFVNVDGRARPWTFELDGRVTSWSPPRVAVRLSDGRDLLPAVLAGVGVTQVLSFMARPLLEQGQVVEVLGPLAAAGPTLHAVTTRSFARTPLATAFTEFSTECFVER